MADIPVLGFAAYSGTGKTTLLKQLIPLLINKEIKVGIIKHSHHDVELDTPGKDSYELRHAGAMQTLLASRSRWSLVTETPEQQEPSLQVMLQQLDQQQLDIILVEGFRDASIDKIELHRTDLNKPLLHETDKHIIAVATDQPELMQTQLPVLDLNNPAMITEFIVQKFNLK